MSEGLGAKIKELRLNQNMTQAALGKLLNVSQMAVYKWEKQLTEPDTLTLIKLANLFNVSIDYLLSTSYDPTPRSHLVHKNTIKTEAMINIPIIKTIDVYPTIIHEITP